MWCRTDTVDSTDRAWLYNARSQCHNLIYSASNWEPLSEFNDILQNRFLGLGYSHRTFKSQKYINLSVALTLEDAFLQAMNVLPVKLNIAFPETVLSSNLASFQEIVQRDDKTFNSRVCGACFPPVRRPVGCWLCGCVGLLARMQCPDENLRGQVPIRKVSRNATGNCPAGANNPWKWRQVQQSLATPMRSATVLENILWCQELYEPTMLR